MKHQLVINARVAEAIAALQDSALHTADMYVRALDFCIKKIIVYQYEMDIEQDAQAMHILRTLEMIRGDIAAIAAAPIEDDEDAGDAEDDDDEDTDVEDASAAPTV